MSDIKQEFVREQLLKLVSSPRCCQLFSASFLYFVPELTMQIRSLNLRLIDCVGNGITKLKIYKPCCTHIMESPELRLRLHEMDLQVLENKLSNKMQLLGSILSSANMRPVVPAHRFSLGPLKQSMMTTRKICVDNIALGKLEPFKDVLMQAVENHRVLVVNGDVTYEKSTILPLCIIDQCVKKRTHCKIICVMREQLLAIYYSERLANLLKEKIGNTIAYQVNLQSRISETSNLIYTTANFLLRVLMGQQVIDGFRHISHVVIDDVHMHEAYVDILLFELRNALRCHPQLRIILLSDCNRNQMLIKYFNEGREIQLSNDEFIKLNRIIYIDEIREMLDDEEKWKWKMATAESLAIAMVKCNAIDENNMNLSNDYFDKIIEHYAHTGSEEAFEAFLYLVHGEFASVNYRHSLSGLTATTIACTFGNVRHLRKLIAMHANPYIMDENNVNAFSAALSNNHMECSEFLQTQCIHNRSFKDEDPSFLDINLITDLVKMIIGKHSEPFGNILIFIANYEQLCRVNFSILRQKFIGNLPSNLFIHTLHKDISKEQLESTLSVNMNEIKIILATDVAESLDHLPSIAYVIDSMRKYYVQYNATAYCNDERYEWISKECMNSRSNLVNVKTTDGNVTCFRLVPRALVDELSDFHKPELLVMPLERVCLTIKLLSPMSLISEYLHNVVVTPPFLNILHAIEVLQSMQILDEMEEVTWLGCRLIDVPIELRYGKMLVYAILLQCLDPVLTIVSFLAFIDPLRLPGNDAFNANSQIITIRNAIKRERKNLSENIPSDHLMYIRLYQKWQNQFRDESTFNTLQDEHHFVLNSILDRVCDIRTQLVGSLRSSQLIHNQGHLSMHHINAKSNSWCLIKSAMAGASYYIGYYDHKDGRIKSNRYKELILHPDSVLRGYQPIHLDVGTMNPPWIIHSIESSSAAFNSISCCTLVTPLTLALFMGSIVDCSNIQMTTLSSTTVHSDIKNNEQRVLFHIDDFLNFNMCISDAKFLVKMRQCFYSCYINYLQHCSSLDYSRRTNYIFWPMVSGVEKLLIQDDLYFDLKIPDSVGLRPKAVPNNFLLKINMINLNATTDWPANYKSIRKSLECFGFCLLDKQFLIIQFSDATEAYYRKYNCETLHDSIQKCIQPYLSPDKLTYLITYNKSKEIFDTVALVTDCAAKGAVKISACFKNSIPVSELRLICFKQHIYMPNFVDRRTVFKLDKQIGIIILYMFAFRKNLLY